MTVDEALQQASSHWAAGGADNHAQARKLAQQILQVEPDHPGALNLAGCAEFEDGNAGVALALFEKAATRAPQDHAIHGNLARSEFAVGRVEPARRRAEYIATIAPQAQGMLQEFTHRLLASQRPPAVASTFFTADPRQLGASVDGFMQAAPGRPAAPKVLIAPHAGHVYSGSTAGLAYALLRARAADAPPIRRVVLFGPAHRVYFKGIALPGVGAYASPLGNVPVDTLGAAAIGDMPFVSTRPDAHGPEHSLEVHLPFLQRALGEFELLPLVVGDATPEQVAQVMERLWGGPETLIVVSTDLSHYHPYDEANAIDSVTCHEVLAMDGTLSHEQACGATPVNALLQLAKARGLRIEQLARCNSGDTAGDKERVVGYASFALYEPPAAAAAELTPDQGMALVQLARSALHEAVGAPKEPAPGVKSFHAPGAAFVTLTKQGQLRGCIGSLQAARPLAEDVRANAAAAALNDPRFPKVTAAEAPSLGVEVSVLTAPVPLNYANQSHAIWQLQPGVHGVILECTLHGRQFRSTYLPQVWEQIPGPRAFMAHLKVKAGLPFDFWSPDIRLQTYRVQKFAEAN